ncbi:eukaryotic translation initiation factor 5B-like [Watersipora subatra]|uniref:eukaryotic translation initiation factor 5B-like n=1 Tax=Watersipora subatra TaxID=2589382 RepID=UPI00355B8E8C
MPKAKKGGKRVVDQESDCDIEDFKKQSDEDDPVTALPAAPSKQKKAKKKKGKKRDDIDDDDDDNDIENMVKNLALSEEPFHPKKKTPKAKSKPTAMSAFAMLNSESDEGKDSDLDSPSYELENGHAEQADDEKELETTSVKKNHIRVADDGEDDLSTRIAALPADSGDESKPSKKDKKKKKKKAKQQVEEGKDLDAILAELDGAKSENKETDAEEKPAIIQHPDEGEEVEESAAAKKKRKKQLQKQRREQEEAGLIPKEPVVELEAGEDEDGDDKKKSKKKKDKKKKAAAAEAEPVAKDKKPKNKQIAAMREALAKAKEEQERIEREEEEKIRKAEEAKRQREEEKKRKEELKRKQKEKEKERIERRKAEGTFLTPAQKAEKQRALQMLEARGITLPSPGDRTKKKFTYGKQRKKKGDKSQDVEVIIQSPEVKEEPIPIIEPEKPKEEEGKAWDDDSDDMKDWDAESDEDEKSVTEASVITAADEEAKENAAEEEEEEESSEEESEESSSEESETSEESSSDDDGMTPKERGLARIMKKQKEAEANKSVDKLRAPVVCVLGHVDTGKTKILDKLRKTNVQDGEAGGITQQIGATNVPLEAIEKQTSFVKDFKMEDLKVPGLLIIDTPGHESFSNLRTRGSSLCDIAILVIDIMHGLEPQTLESIQLLKKGKTPFVVALNKIDRLYGWKPSARQDVQAVIKKQTANTKAEFDERASMVITQLAEQGLNSALYYENTSPKEYISLVPTSAHSGDGIGNIIALLCEYSQTFLAKRIAITDNLQCTVMEVKALPGLGTTVDVILVNGKLRNGDVVVLPGTEGPIVTHIRELLMPEPMKELRVKSQYRHHKEVEAAQGVKIVGKDLDKVLAGLPMYVAKYQDEVEVYKEWIAAALKNVLNAIKLSPTGVFVQASTLGSMEALLEYLRSVKVPYAGINIGPVHKKDVMKASAMLEHGEPEYATILAFDVKVERDANDLADSLGVKIFTAEIIYHLFDAFKNYQEELLEIGQRENNHLKIFPCKLRVLPQFVFNSRDPIIMGVSVEAGFLSNGTPICVPSKEFTNLGIVTSVEKENKPVERATKGMEVCIKIENLPGQAPRLFGRHFDEKDMLVSKISRESIDAVKKYWKRDMSKDDWRLIIDLKKTFEIM